jgi:hypothetical protein
MKRRYHLGESDGSIEMGLKINTCVKLQTEFIWLRISPVNGSSEYGNEPSDFI